VTKEEKVILEAVNAELDRRGVLARKRFAPHQFFPMRRCFVCKLDQYRTARIYTQTRALDVFTERQNRDGWGNAVEIGRYERRGWLAKLVSDAADVVEGKKP